MNINFKKLEKNQIIKSNQLGVDVKGILLESVKQGRGFKKIVLIKTFASEIGLFDETGSVYDYQITKVKLNNEWENVIHD